MFPTITPDMRRNELKKREKLKTLINRQWAGQKEVAITFLQDAFKTAPEEGQTAHIGKWESYTNNFGIQNQKKVWITNPDAKFIKFKFGPAVFKVVNSKKAIEETIRKIKEQHFRRTSPYRVQAGNSIVVGRWPFKSEKVKFNDWKNCTGYANGWITTLYTAWKGKSNQVRKKEKFGFNAPKREEILLHIMCCARHSENSEEMIVMRGADKQEWWFNKSHFMQLYGLCGWQKPSYKIVKISDRVSSIPGAGIGTLEISDNGVVVAYLTWGFMGLWDDG
jgi:hypothetical protein